MRFFYFRTIGFWVADQSHEDAEHQSSQAQFCIISTPFSRVFYSWCITADSQFFTLYSSNLFHVLRQFTCKDKFIQLFVVSPKDILYSAFPPLFTFV